MKSLVTGGLGFIGSHIVDELIRRGDEVIVYDNFSSGFVAHLDSASRLGSLQIVKGDILDLNLLQNAMQGVERVFHLAANADVRGGKKQTRIDLEQNTIGTYNVLEAMRMCGASEIIFTSSATVYGEPLVFPTPESYAPLQTSLYGASKLAAEGMIQAYCEYFNMRSFIFRFVSWIGERYSHGVVFDFMNKLRRDATQLEILGDGNQRKSYLHVEDGIAGVFLAVDSLPGNKNVLNLGHEEYMNVIRLADIVCEELGLNNVKYTFTGGARGWLGDSPFVQLDISLMKKQGFTPQIPIEDGIRRTVRYLKANAWLLDSRT